MTTTHPSPNSATGSEHSASVPDTAYLTRPDGRVAYEVAGTGPLLVLVPGMGDLRAGYRFLAPALRNAGYRVACSDLRGHGDSDATFASYGDEETAGDTIAVVEELGEPAIVTGNSMGAGAAVLAAVRRPELVRGLVLIGPFVRNGQISALQRLLLRVAMARPWAAITWKAYLPKLYAGPPQISMTIAARWRRACAAPDTPGRSHSPPAPTTPRPSTDSATSRPRPWW
jgi:pimeloyl-ACP methyl ester carboxylesterase